MCETRNRAHDNIENKWQIIQRGPSGSEMKDTASNAKQMKGKGGKRTLKWNKKKGEGDLLFAAIVWCTTELNNGAPMMHAVLRWRMRRHMRWTKGLKLPRNPQGRQQEGKEKGLEHWSALSSCRDVEEIWRKKRNRMRDRRWQKMAKTLESDCANECVVGG